MEINNMKKVNLRDNYILWVVAASLIGIFIRILFFDHVTSDYSYYLTGWMNAMDKVGRFKRFGLDLGDYTCPYMYVLAIITLLPVNRLYAIKAVSCFFDFFLAYFSFETVLTLTRSKNKAAWVYAAVFLCPTVIMNSAVWGQCDVIYSSFIIGALSLILKDKPFKSCILYGFAFALKLQSIFLAPLFICLWLKKKIKILQLFIIPIIYCLGCVPAVIVGRNVVDVLTVYFKQSAEYPHLSFNAPSFLAFAQDFGISSTRLSILLAVGFTGMFVLLILVSVFKAKFTINNLQWLELACVFAVVIPFLLPKMHERYFYISDIICIIYAFCHKKRWFAPVLSVSASAYTYLRYICKGIFERPPLWIGSVLMLTVAAFLIYDFYRGYFDKQRKKDATVDITPF